MAAVQALPALLETLTTSLTTLSSTLPSASSIHPPENGISLLDTKNELLLSYLQNLVFLILLKLRNAKSQIDSSESPTSGKEDGLLADDTVKRLVELRLYLERGVKPLENKLRYQIDRAVRVAEDDALRVNGKGEKRASGSKSKASKASSDSEAESGSESESSTRSSASDPDASVVSRANLASFIRPSTSTKSNGRVLSSSAQASGSSAVYRPPRIAPTSLPSTAPASSRPSRPRKSHLLDDYITTELSAAPMAEPSIGTNIVERGRRDVLSVRERQVAAERQRYEEENLVRLPGASKKDKRRGEGERVRRGQFGGEEWSGLGGSAERIVDLVKRQGKSKGVLERSRKRAREDSGAAGGDGSGSSKMGGAFEKKRKLLEQRRRK